MIRMLGLLLALSSLFTAPLTGSEPITVGETRVTNSYPESVAFEVEAASSAGAITSVDINLAIRGASSTLTEPADFTPGQQVIARYVWDTFRDGVAPGTPIQYTWTVRDDAGNRFTTEPEDYVVTDSRFTWQTLENDDVALWWYDGDAAFGQRVFDTAAQALAAMKEHSGQSLPFRIHVVLYGSDADFDSWHSYVREWVGGQAFPGMGLTVQIIPPGNSRRVRNWTDEVIPHEIAHLFFFQVTDTPLAVGPPTWLIEGFAQYFEFRSPEEELDSVRQRARRGDLIPLRLLSGSFYGDANQVYLMYAESLSAVTFLFERWGDEGMAQLLSSYRAGDNTDEALLEATGLDFEEFQLAWWEWLDGQPGLYPTPSVLKIPTVPPLPTRRPVATPVSTVAPGASPEPTVPLAATPAPAEPPTIAPTPTESPITPTPTSDASADGPASPPCIGALGLLVILAAWGHRRQAGSARAP